MSDQSPKLKHKPPKRTKGMGLGPRTINGAALDVRSASAFCGFSEKQTRGLVARRLIPFKRLGGRIVFLKAELEASLAALDGCTPEEASDNRNTRYASGEGGTR